MGFLENHPRDTTSKDLDVATDEVASENGNHCRDMMIDGSFSYMSFRKFVFFSKSLGLLLKGNEKEIVSLLRKLEA